MKKRHIFIIGSKGIPAEYGGFETFVDKLTENQKNTSVQYYVACMNAKKTAFTHNGAKCFNIKVPNVGAAKAVYYDIAALKWCILNSINSEMLLFIYWPVESDHLLDIINV